jgi:uncharacterized protein
MKTHLNSIIIALSVVISATLISVAYTKKGKSNQSISVTGLGEEHFTSDLIVWKAYFSKSSRDLKSASSELNLEREKIKRYLIKKGIIESDIVFSAVDIQKQYSSQYDGNGNYVATIFSGYSLSQSLRIESLEVDKIERIAREATELINQGIELVSNPPDYYYTKLAQLKLKMIENATKDARERADKIAVNANSSLGNLKNASMGIIQITAKNSAEDYSWGGSFNTSSKLKTASITIRLEYGIN